MKKLTRITVVGTAFMLVIAAYILVTPPLAAFGATNLNSSKSNIYRVGNDTYISIDINSPYAPMAASEDGNNVYVVWWTNKSGGNWEVMFRASNDGGATFGDKINLSNSPNADSQNAQVIAAGNNVYVSWWEINPVDGTTESALRVSTDNGRAFGPVLMLGSNGIINTRGGDGVATEEATTSSADQVVENDTTTTTGGTAGAIEPETQEGAVNATDQSLAMLCPGRGSPPCPPPLPDTTSPPQETVQEEDAAGIVDGATSSESE
jgi:hypothetical protein